MFYRALTEKRILLHFILFYFLVFIYIIFGNLLFKSLFFEYFAIITLIFAFLCGYLGMIFESFRPDKGQWRPISTALLLCLLFIILRALIYGFEPLFKFNSYVLKTAFVEEVVFRSLMFGMALRLWQVELISIEKYRFQIYKIQRKDLKIVVFLAMFLSMAFSLFHFWDLHFNMGIPMKVAKLFIDRFVGGVVLCMFYLISGRKVYPSIVLHYAINVYGSTY